MQPKWHALWGFVFSVLLVEFFSFSLFAGLVVFLSSVFIDLDHATRYAIMTKNWNPKKFWKWSVKETEKLDSLSLDEKKKLKYPFFFMHGIEVLIILFFLGKGYLIFFWVFLGFLFHMILDYVAIFRKGYPFWFKFSEGWILWRNWGKEGLSLILQNT